MARIIGICVVGCLLAAAVTAFVYLYKENQLLSNELATATAKVVALQAERDAAEKALKSQSDLERQIYEHRQQIDEALEGSGDLDDDSRIEYLLRLLREDAEARNNPAATESD